LKFRVDDQRDWYVKKSEWNRKQARMGFWIIIFANTTAFCLAVISYFKPDWAPHLPLESLLVIAGAVLTWTQTKKFQDLSSSYKLTASEITNFRENHPPIISEKSLSKFVKNSENAFSREHTQWAARKD